MRAGKHTFVITAAVAVCGSAVNVERSGPSWSDRPNIIIILVDDTRYGEVGAFNRAKKLLTLTSFIVAGRGLPILMLLPAVHPPGPS